MEEPPGLSPRCSVFLVKPDLHIQEVKYMEVSVCVQIPRQILHGSSSNSGISYEADYGSNLSRSPNNVAFARTRELRVNNRFVLLSCKIWVFYNLSIIGPGLKDLHESTSPMYSLLISFGAQRSTFDLVH